MAELASRGLPCGVTAEERLEEWVSRRISGEPFQYIVGSVEFYSVELEIGPGVLIPRPETEQLVEFALDAIRAIHSPHVLDLCTGSGAIALAIASERKDAACTGVDISEEALFWARRNLSRLGVPNCRLLKGDLFAPLERSEEFDLITANPPYVSPEEYECLPKVVKEYEPRMALEAEEEGLALERRIINEAPRWLKPGGMLILEMGEGQGDALRKSMASAGFSGIEIRRDLAGRERIALGRAYGAAQGPAAH